MKPEDTTPPDYFVSPLPAIWTIEETCEAIEWQEPHSTAMLLEHCQFLCRVLAQQLGGLPPLTAVIYVVDALSRGWSAELALARIQPLVGIYEGSASHSLIVNFSTAESNLPNSDRAQQLAEWLASLKNLDDEFRYGVRAHAAFLCELFEQLPHVLLTREHETDQALSWLDNIVGDRSSMISLRLKAETAAVTRAAVALDYASIVALDGEALRMRMLTGLDGLPDTEPLEIVDRFPLATLAKALARRDDELGTMARLAQTVASTLSLPRLPSDPDVLPIGGVSDVTNRGKPDRLLMSELALDSDLMIARIANGQALYLRREQPPQPEPKHRCLILEAGVRMWGTMRLYGAAFALGACLAQEQRAGAKIDVITVAGDRAWQEDFTSRAGIQRFYGRLEADAHPAAAIVKLAERELLELDIDSQPILVLSQACESDVEFRRLMQEFPKPHMIARIEPHGQVELLQRSAAGDVTLQRMQLNQSAIGNSQATRTPRNDQLPMYLQLAETPLRFSAHLQGECVQISLGHSLDSCWILTKDRRVLLLTDRDLGAIEIGNMPAGKILASHIAGVGCWLLVIESTPPGSGILEHLLVEAHINRGMRVRPIKLGTEKTTDVSYCFDRGQLLRVGKEIAFLDSLTGATLASAPRTHRHLGGAFFGTNEIYVATREDDSVRWRHLGKVPTAAGCAARLEDGVPVVYAQDLSWMVRLDGPNAKVHATQWHINTQHPHAVLRINPAGTAMLVGVKGVTWSNAKNLECTSQEMKMVKLWLDKPQIGFWGARSSHRVTSFEYEGLPMYQTINVRNHIDGISFNPSQGLLTLYRADLQIVLCHDGNGWLSLKSSKAIAKQARVVRFETLIAQPAGDQSRWKLKHAKLRSGDAWLDGRGLLHLRAKDDTELSLALCDDMVAGWHSSGIVFGPKYFTSVTGTTPAPESVIQWLQTFAQQQVA